MADIISTMIVYSALNLVNGKRYVGITSKGLSKRLNGHWYSDSLLGRAFRKYGMESFKVEIIDETDDWTKLCEKEQYWIKIFGCMSPEGYNLTAGGEGVLGLVHSKETLEKMSKSGKNRTDFKPENLVDNKFGRLLVVSIAPSQGKDTMWNCICDCGQKHTVRATLLKNGKCKSCGCLRREVCAQKVKTHGRVGEPLYATWMTMKSRCLNPNNANYKQFGAVGIRVCERWLNSFENFLVDMGEKPEGMIFGRKNPNESYSPENCHWTTREESCLNRRSNVLLELNGVIKPLQVWSDELEIPHGGLRSAIRRGLSLQDYIGMRGIKTELIDGRI